MSTYMQAQLKRACMWTRELLYLSVCVGAKNGWVSVCLCIHPSIRLSIGINFLFLTSIFELITSMFKFGCGRVSICT